VPGLGCQLTEKVVNLSLDAVKLRLSVAEVEWLMPENLLADSPVLLYIARSEFLLRRRRAWG
jgi:hypothetical protein